MVATNINNANYLLEKFDVASIVVRIAPCKNNKYVIT